MYFKDVLPDSLQEYPNVSQFMDVLDALQDSKQEIIAESLRSNNAGVLMDSKWLLKKLEEFGVTDLPVEYPVQLLWQLLLNINTVCSTRGSKKGIELYCSILSFGEVTVDDSAFYTEPKILLLDSLIQGFITADNSKLPFCLVEDNSYINPKVTLKITIKSRYFNGNYPTEATLIKNYLESSIDKQLGFSPNKEVKFTYQTRSAFYFHELLNPYFV